MLHLRDLAALYRALITGPLGPAEAEALHSTLGAWAPLGRVEDVLQEPAPPRLGPISLGAVVARLGTSLDADAQARVLSDLRQIAGADGRVTASERDLIAFVEQAFGR